MENKPESSNKILKALAVQEREEGLTEDLKLVKLWYDIVAANSNSNNVFMSLVRTKWIKYGELSYESRLFYYASEELKVLYNGTFKQGN